MRLLELASAIGALLVLIGMIFPILISREMEADLARARTDLRDLAGAIRQFHADTGIGPTRGLGGDDRRLHRLIGPGREADGAYYHPDVLQGELADHLLRNTPGLEDEQGYDGWQGPYWPGYDSDPWGQAYVFVAYPMFCDDPRHAVVVSAGPNGTFDGDYSSPWHAVAVGDDLLEVVFAKGAASTAPLY